MGNLFVATTTRPYDDNNELDTYVEYMAAYVPKLNRM